MLLQNFLVLLAVTYYVNQSEEGEFTEQALNAENQTYQEDIMCKFYNIPDYDSYLKSSTLNERPIALKSLCFLLNFINTITQNLRKKFICPPLIITVVTYI